MIKYRRTQLKMGVIDTPIMQAVVGFVSAVEAGTAPDRNVLATVVECLRKATAPNDQPHVLSAQTIIHDFDTGNALNKRDLLQVASAFHKIFGGAQPAEIWGNHLGLGKTVGRQPHTGFTPSDVVSAYIELQRRRKGGGYGALEFAKRQAGESFIDLAGYDQERQIDRDWSAGRSIAETLETSELEQIIAPYKTN